MYSKVLETYHVHIKCIFGAKALVVLAIYLLHLLFGEIFRQLDHFTLGDVSVLVPAVNNSASGLVMILFPVSLPIVELERHLSLVCPGHAAALL